MFPDWDAVRAEFPALKGWTFLNTATFGQLSQRTVSAVAGHFARRDSEACSDFLEWFDDAGAIRASAARLIHCSPDDVAFITNASTALGLLIGGLEWKAGDQIVSLENEFPNNLYWPALLQQSGVEFRETAWRGIEQSLTGRTRLVLVSAVNYSTGFRTPVEELGRVLRDRGILYYIDGTQSLGALQFDTRTVQPDLFAVHGYKWLLSPNGSGFMYVSPSLREKLKPNVVGWRSHKDWRRVDSLHHGAPEFVSSAEKYEGGMLNFPSLYGMGASLEMLLELGGEAIEQRVLELAAECGQALRSLGADVDSTGSPIITARIPGHDASQIVSALKKQRILVSARHGRLRISTHFYNNQEDIARLIESLRVSS